MQTSPYQPIRIPTLDFPSEHASTGFTDGPHTAQMEPTFFTYEPYFARQIQDTNTMVLDDLGRG